MRSGTPLLFLGVCGLLLSVWMRPGGPFSGRFVGGADHRHLLMGLSVWLIFLGMRSMRRMGKPSNGWRPSEPGVRFQRVVVYSRPGCGLCDEAVELISRYSSYFNDLSVVDISGSEDLEEEYGLSIPVVEVDGEIRFRGRIEEILWQRLIEGTRPLM